MSSRLAPLACAAALTALLAACTGGGNGQPLATPTPTATVSSTPTPTASPTPTLSDEEAAKQANIEAAQARYVEYRRLGDEILADPGQEGAFEKIRPYISSEERIAWWQSIPQQYVDLGRHQTGVVKVLGFTVTDYEGDPVEDGTQVVNMDVCVDGTGVDVLKEDGTSAVAWAPETPIVTKVSMQRQPDQRWTVEVEDSSGITEC